MMQTEYCGDCPDHEGCMTGYPCDFVKAVDRGVSVEEVKRMTEKPSKELTTKDLIALGMICVTVLAVIWMLV